MNNENGNGTTMTEQVEAKESLLDVLLIPPTTEQGVAKSLFVEAREKAIQKSARALKTWHKSCLRDAVLIMTAQGEHEAAQKAAVEYLKLDLGR